MQWLLDPLITDDIGLFSDKLEWTLDGPYFTHPSREINQYDFSVPYDSFMILTSKNKSSDDESCKTGIKCNTSYSPVTIYLSFYTCQCEWYCSVQIFERKKSFPKKLIYAEVRRIPQNPEWINTIITMFGSEDALISSPPVPAAKALGLALVDIEGAYSTDVPMELLHGYVSKRFYKECPTDPVCFTFDDFELTPTFDLFITRLESVINDPLWFENNSPLTRVDYPCTPDDDDDEDNEEEEFEVECPQNQYFDPICNAVGWTIQLQPTPDGLKLCGTVTRTHGYVRKYQSGRYVDDNGNVLHSCVYWDEPIGPPIPPKYTCIDAPPNWSTMTGVELGNYFTTVVCEGGQPDVDEDEIREDPRDPNDKPCGIYAILDLSIGIEFTYLKEIPGQEMENITTIAYKLYSTRFTLPLPFDLTNDQMKFLEMVTPQIELQLDFSGISVRIGVRFEIAGLEIGNNLLEWTFEAPWSLLFPQFAPALSALAASPISPYSSLEFVGFGRNNC